MQLGIPQLRKVLIVVFLFISPLSFGGSPTGAASVASSGKQAQSSGSGKSSQKGGYRVNPSYLGAASAVRNYNMAMEMALLNPMDDFRRDAVNSALNDMNSKLNALAGQLKSGSINSQDYQSMSNDLAKMVDSSNDSSKDLISNALNNPATPSPLPAIPPIADPTVDSNAAVTVANTSLSSEIINLNELGKAGSTGAALQAANLPPTSELPKKAIGTDSASLENASPGVNGLIPPSILHGVTSVDEKKTPENEKGPSNLNSRALGPGKRTEAGEASAAADSSADGSAARRPAGEDELRKDLAEEDAEPDPGIADEEVPWYKRVLSDLGLGALAFEGDVSGEQNISPRWKDRPLRNRRYHPTHEGPFGAWGTAAMIGVVVFSPLFVLFFYLGSTAKKRKRKI